MLKGIKAPVLLEEEVKASLSTSGNKFSSTVFLLVIKTSLFACCAWYVITDDSWHLTETYSQLHILNSCRIQNCADADWKLA